MARERVASMVFGESHGIKNVRIIVARRKEDDSETNETTGVSESLFIW